MTGKPTSAARECAALLQDAPAVLEIPSDHPRPTALGPEVATVAAELPPPLVTKVQQTAKSGGTDVYTVLLAAWLGLLACTADEQDLVVGCGGRVAAPDAASLHVLRHLVQVEDGFQDLLATTGAALGRVEAAGPVTLPDLLSAMSVDPGLAKHPVFQVGFTLPAGRDAPAWPGRRSTPIPPDVVLVWWQEDDRIGCRLDYARELFSEQRAARLLGHFVTLLENAVTTPDRPLWMLGLLTDAEFRAWNDTDQEHDATLPLVARFRRQLAADPEAPAVEGLGAGLTYRELAAQADLIARRLQDHGVGPDATVAVWADRSPEMVVAVLGVLVAGGAYVPIDPGYPQARRQFMLQDSGVRVVLTQRHLLKDVGAAHAGPVLAVEDVLESRPDAAAGPVSCPATGHDLGYVIYTSGSTGQPKGVALPQSALDNMIAWQQRRPQARPATRTLQFSSLSFDVSFQEIFSTWCSGGTLVLIADAVRRDPLSLLDFLIEHRISRLFLPYVALRGLASAVANSGRSPHELREIYTAGEQLQLDPVLRAMMQGLPQCTLENQYGPSESHVVTAHTLEGDVDRWPAVPPVGRPIDNSQTHVLDAHRQPRPVGVPGELYLGGRCLARGYLGRPDLTAERFSEPGGDGEPAGRLYRTGDLARWLPDGTLEFLGRTDSQIKFRGYRIEPGEIGAVLSGCPGVSQCVAVVRRVGGVPRLTAYLLPDGPGSVEFPVAHSFAREHLPAHMVPSHYLVVDSFPLTSSGKVDTQSLPEANFDRGILSAPYRTPSSQDELALADIWQTLLQVPAIGLDDDFFELGGDSLAGAEMVQLVSERLGVELPLGALAQAPTIAELAASLRGAPGAVWRSLVPLRASGSRTPLFIVHGGSGNVATFPVLARALPEDQPVFALQWDGLAGRGGHRSVEGMADHYLSEVRSVQDHGPYLLAGQCIGGLVARVMVQKLLDAGEQVDLLVMYDSPHLGSAAYVPPPRTSLVRVLVDGKARRRARADLRRWYRRTVPTSDPVRLGSRAMRAAAWRHRPAPLSRPVPTHYFGSGENNARRARSTGPGRMAPWGGRTTRRMTSSSTTWTGTTTTSSTTPRRWRF